jgi:hypothetical protein
MSMQALMGRALRMAILGACLLALTGAAIAAAAGVVTRSEKTKATAAIAAGQIAVRATRLSADAIRVTIALHAAVHSDIPVDFNVYGCHHSGHAITCPAKLGSVSRVVPATAGSAVTTATGVVLHGAARLDCVHVETSTAQTLPLELTHDLGPLVCPRQAATG